jgi:P4 family phage/plasmid primase-like protien
MNKIKVKKGFVVLYYENGDISKKTIKHGDYVYAEIDFMVRHGITYDLCEDITIVPTIRIPDDAKLLWKVDEKITGNAHKLRGATQELLLLKKRAEAIDMVAKQFQSENKIYAIRNDEKNEMWIYDDGIYVPHAKTYIEEYCSEAFGIAYTSHISNAVAKIIQVNNYVNQEDFFQVQKETLICCKNGLFDLSTKTLIDYNKNNIFFSKINAEYNANAQCTKFLEFLSQIVENKEDIDIIQEVFGWFFFKKYQFEKIIMFVGDGRNGKSKLIEIMTYFLHAESVSQITPHTMEDEESFSLSTMFGKLANLVADIGDGSLRKTQKLKALSGNDTIQVKRKFMTDLRFKNVAKMVFGCNELPIIYDTKSGMWERWILLNFPYKFVEKERVGENQYHKLRDDDVIEGIINNNSEMSGILNWALEGYYRLANQKRFSYKKTPEQTKAIWLRKADSFESFILDCCDFDYNYEISKDDLRRTYSQYVSEHKLRIKNDKHVARSLGEKGITDIRKKGSDTEYYWQGIRLKTAVIVQDAKKQKVIDLIHHIPQNNAHVLDIAFGTEYIRYLVNNGDLIEVRQGTLILGGK